MTPCIIMDKNRREVAVDCLFRQGGWKLPKREPAVSTSLKDNGEGGREQGRTAYLT